MKSLLIRRLILSKSALFILLTASGCTAAAENATLQGDDLMTFDRCVELGGIVLKTLPPSCMLGGQQVFAKPNRVPSSGMEVEIDQNDVCIDHCGDGICAEIVCLGEGCPCPETPRSCPEDCEE